MKLFWKLYLAIVLMALLAEGQRTDTIYQRIVTDNTTGLPSNVVRNIGQSQHTLFFTYTDSGGACVMGNFAPIYLEGSHDNASFVRISPSEAGIINTSGTNYLGWISAYGAFPYVRVNFSSVAALCKANGWYTGTVPTVAFPQMLMALSSSYRTAYFTPLGADNTIVGNATATGRVVVYGVDVYNGSGAPASIQLNEKTSCAGAIAGYALNRAGLPDKGSVTWPASLVPYHIGTPGKSLCATVTGGPVDLKLQYRIE